MRATRNASKNTPPAKKAVKATTPAKTAVQKNEQEPKGEAISVTDEIKTVEVITLDIDLEDPQPSASDAPDANGRSKAAEAPASLEAGEKSKDTPKAKAAAPKKKAATPKKTLSEPVEKEVEPVKEEAKPAEVVKVEVESEVVNQASPHETPKEDVKEAVEEALKSDSKEMEPQVDVPTEMEVQAPEEDEEMEEEAEDVEDEIDEEEDHGEGVENEDDGENEGMEEGNEEDYDEEEEEGEEEEEEEEAEAEEEEGDDGEGEEELLEQRPVTERQKRKKLEVFVGGLDKDATEDDVKKAFEVVGEVVEVRLMRHSQTGKNKGYAFVRFANVEQAKRAATELERTKIRDKECGVVPSEDNDTLFVGNICKTWKTEQVLEKLKEYGIDGIEEMAVMDDPKNEGLNRGFAFVELATHNEAVKAFKRLSRPDAIFGSDRSAKIAWAEPFNEPDEEVMAKVKSVFVDGMPSSWDDTKVKEYFGKFGGIERVVLAKNMPRSKRNDFAFVNFVTREGALACVEALKDSELSDGDNKVKVKVALAKPAPRKKHMKGSRGNYPIGGRPAERGKGWVPRGVRFGPRRGRGGRGLPRGGRMGRASGRRLYDEASVQKIIRAMKHQPVPDERLRERRPGARGARNIAGAGPGPTRPSRGAARGGYSRREEVNHMRGSQLSRPSQDYSSPRGRGSRRGGGAYRDDYIPRGARLSPGLPRPRGYSGRPPPREDAYPRRPDRGYGRDVDGGYASGIRDYGEAGPGVKRPYAALDENAAYYETGRRGYPRPRIDYADPGPVTGYSEPARASLGRSSLGGRNALPGVGGSSVSQASLSIYDQGSGLGGSSLSNTGSSALYGSAGHGYSSMLPGSGDYVSSAGELRGGPYSSSLYGSRSGSGYGLPGGGAGSYY